MDEISGAKAAGTLDPFFGDNGVIDLSNEAVSTNPHDILALPGGKFLYADVMPNNRFGIRLRRMNVNGFFESSFGGQGWVEINLPGGNVKFVKLSNYLGGGWLLTCGYYVLTVGEEDAFGQVFVIQLDLNGQPVPSFGENGRVLIDPLKLVGSHRQDPFQGYAKQEDAKEIGRAPIRLERVPVSSSVLPNGKIFLLHGQEGGITQSAMLIRLQSDGSLNKTFNGTGFSLIKPEGINFSNSVAHCLAVQKDGKILVSGFYQAASGNAAYVMRLDANGLFDPSFNGGRVVTVADPDYQFYFPGDISIRESDGAIVVVGYAGPNKNVASNGSGFIAVLSAEGSFNLVFNGGKPLFSRMIPEGVRWEFCAWQQDNQAIIVAGSAPLLVARFRPNGALDSSFNGQGWVSYQPGSMAATYQGMTITQDNKLGLCVAVSGKCHVLRYLTS